MLKIIVSMVFLTPTLENNLDNNIHLNKIKLSEIKPKTRGKSNIGIKIENSHNISLYERKIQSSSKNRPNNYDTSIVVHNNSSINNNKINNLSFNKLQIDDKFKLIKSLWNETGVTEIYKNIYEGIANRLDSIYKNGYYDYELSSLAKFKDKLIKLFNEISAREKTIELLNQFDRILFQEKDKEKKKKTIQDIIKTFQHLRVLSINIVNHYVKMRKVSSYAVLNGKYDLDKAANLSSTSSLLSPEQFDKNYLIKMKNDTDFLYTSNLRKYFNFAIDSDPFLIALNNIDNDMNFDNNGGLNEVGDKFNRIPIEEDMMISIRNCQFIMLEEFAYYEISGNCNKSEITVSTGKSQTSIYKLASNNSNKNEKAISIKYSANSKKPYGLKPLSVTKVKNSNIKIINDLSPLDFNSNQNLNSFNVNHPKSVANKNITNKIENGIIPYKKINGDFKNENYYNFENILTESKSSSKKTEMLIKEKDLKKVDKIIHYKKKEGKGLAPLSGNKYHKNKDNDISSSNINSNDISGISVKNDPNKAVIRINNKIRIDNYNIISDVETNARKSEIDKLNKLEVNSHKTILDEVKEIIQKAQISNREPHIKKEYKNYEEEDKAYNLLKKMEQELKNSFDEILLDNYELEHIEVHTKEIGKNSLLIDHNVNLVDINESKLDKLDRQEKLEIHHPKINENINEFDIARLYFEFLSGELLEFTKEYQAYLEKLDEDQKVAFKIETNLLLYIKGNFTKIVKFMYKDNSNSNRLVGIAFLYFDYQSDSSIKLQMPNFSTLYFQNYFEIFNNFLQFTKINSSFNELIIELYHGIKNDSFYLNEYIKLIVKDKLGFKWLTLENTGTERRTKYRWVNPDKISENKNIFYLTNFVALELSDTNIGLITNENKLKENEINLFPLTCLLGEMIYNYDFEIKNKQFSVLNVEKLKKYTKHFMKVLGSNLNGVNNFMKENLNFTDNINSNDINNFTCDFLFSSIMNVATKFENLNSFKHNEYLYNRIGSDIDVLKHAGSNQLYYLIRCTNENYSILIGNLDDESIPLEKNIFTNFLEIYSVGFFINFF